MNLKTNGKLVFCLRKIGLFNQSHSTGKHKLCEYGVVRGRIIAINVITDHFAQNGNERSTSEKNPVNM